MTPLQQWLKDNNINVNALARGIQMNPSNLRMMISGERSMTARAAEGLRMQLPHAPHEIQMEMREGGPQCSPVHNLWRMKGGVTDHYHEREGKTERAWGSKAKCLYA